MGLFSNNNNNTPADSGNYQKGKATLKPKDGKTHVLLTLTYTISTKSDCNTFSMELDSLLSSMQDADYEIVDVKISPKGTSDDLYALVIYR